MVTVSFDRTERERGYWQLFAALPVHNSGDIYYVSVRFNEVARQHWLQIIQIREVTYEGRIEVTALHLQYKIITKIIK